MFYSVVYSQPVLEYIFIYTIKTITWSKIKAPLAVSLQVGVIQLEVILP